jgi:hypothetical protein
MWKRGLGAGSTLRQNKRSHSSMPLLQVEFESIAKTDISEMLCYLQIVTHGKSSPRCKTVTHKCNLKEDYNRIFLHFLQGTSVWAYVVLAACKFWWNYLFRVRTKIPCCFYRSPMKCSAALAGESIKMFYRDYHVPMHENARGESGWGDKNTYTLHSRVRWDWTNIQ